MAPQPFPRTHSAGSRGGLPALLHLGSPWSLEALLEVGTLLCQAGQLTHMTGGGNKCPVLTVEAQCGITAAVIHIFISAWF